MKRRNGPIQQWVDSIPSPLDPVVQQSTNIQESRTNNSVQSMPKDIPHTKDRLLDMSFTTTSAPIEIPQLPVLADKLSNSLPQHKLVRDTSFQSDSSYCSSVESILEWRKVDPEAILLNLGFGADLPNKPEDPGPITARIPKRFLQPSKLKGIVVDNFVKNQQETNESFESVSLGYRGLTGSPYVAPSEIVQKIMERLRENESFESDQYSCYNCEQDCLAQQNGTLSVLSPDNREFLERIRCKSPDLRSKRMIIGQKSFAFDYDGDLIEVNSSNVNSKNSEGERQGPNELFNISNEMIENRQAKPFFNSLSQEKNKYSEGIAIENSKKSNSIDNNTEIIEPIRVSSRKTHFKLTKQNAITDSDSWESNSHLRRASDGFWETETKMADNQSIIDGRRFSDGTVNSRNNDSSLYYRRRNLKRQSRISDNDEDTYCASETSPTNTITYNEFASVFSSDSSQDKNDISEKLKTLDSVLISDNSEYDTENYIQPETYIRSQVPLLHEKVLNTDLRTKESENNEPICSSDKNIGNCGSDIEHVCSHDETNSITCCFSNIKNDKQSEKNKKKSDRRTKNKREMTEIRGILSSVLSVRMEPGF